MLDGILGRGFSVKCKSLIKATGARIAVVRRRAEAKQRFLNEDLAKLLSNGLDINAYGRTEEFLSGMNLLSCYDYVVQSCEYIIKQLSRMQKQRECPEECREVVGSLMYAAARFSDLPELRELRDIFQQKYGSCLETFVNQKFVEKLSSRPPAKEKRLQVLQDIASEFSIKWDSKGFERRMAAPSVVSQLDEQKVDIVKQRPGLLDEKSRIKSHGEGKICRRDEGDHQICRKEIITHRQKSVLKGSSSQGDAVNLNDGRIKLTENKPSYPTEKCDDLKAERSNNASHGKILDNNAHNSYLRISNSIANPRKGETTEALFHEKTTSVPSCVEQLGKTEKAFSLYKYSGNDIAVGSVRKGVDEGSDRLKSCSNNALPPPYTKSDHGASRPPYVKVKEDKQKLGGGSKDSVSNLDKHLIDPGSFNRSHDHLDCEEKNVAPASLKSYGHEKELEYQEERIPLPKPRSIRRKHHKPSSSNNAVDNLEDVKAGNRSSTSRRKDHPKKGLQNYFEEEHHIKDDEEKMIDKLLIHYSKKPSSFDTEKLKKKLLHPMTSGGESSFDERMNVHDRKHEAVPTPARSVSLPHEQAAASQEVKKVFARSITLQPDNQAKHVHPKLPNYDDIAARFAALKGR